jgi:hypothetical protein
VRPAIEAGLMLLAGAEKAYMRPVLDRSRKSIYETASNVPLFAPAGFDAFDVASSSFLFVPGIFLHSGDSVLDE